MVLTKLYLCPTKVFYYKLIIALWGYNPVNIATFQKCCHELVMERPQFELVFQLDLIGTFYLFNLFTIFRIG